MAVNKGLTITQIKAREAAIPQKIVKSLPGTIRDIAQKTGYVESTVRKHTKAMLFNGVRLIHISGWTQHGNVWAAIFSAGDGPDEPKPDVLTNELVRRARLEAIALAKEEDGAADDSLSLLRSLDKTSRWIQDVVLQGPPATPFSTLFAIQDIQAPRTKRYVPPQQNRPSKIVPRLYVSGRNVG